MISLPYDVLEVVAQHTARISEHKLPRVGATTVSALALTAHFLREPAQRGLFSSLNFTGWKRQIQHKNRRTAIRAALARVQGIASHAHLQSYIKHLVLRDWVSGQNDRDLWAIGEALWELVRVLPHLREVECRDVIFDSPSWTKLSGRRRFRRLELRSCQVPYDTSVDYHVERLALAQPQTAQGWHVQSLANAATLMVRPSLLSELVLDAPVLVSELLDKLLDVGLFPALAKLSLAIAHPTPIITSFMRQCPNLVIFKLSPSPNVDAISSVRQLQRTSVPLLQDFAGPLDMVVSLMHGRAIRTILVVLEMDEAATTLMFSPENDMISECSLLVTHQRVAVAEPLNSDEDDQRCHHPPVDPPAFDRGKTGHQFERAFDNAFLHILGLALVKMRDIDERARISVTTLTLLANISASQHLLRACLPAIQEVFPNIAYGAVCSRRRTPDIDEQDITTYGRVLGLADL